MNTEVSGKALESHRGRPPILVSESFKFSSDMHNSVGHLTPAATQSQTYPRSLDRVILAV